MFELQNDRIYNQITGTYTKDLACIINIDQPTKTASGFKVGSVAEMQTIFPLYQILDDDAMHFVLVDLSQRPLAEQVEFANDTFAYSVSSKLYAAVCQ